MEFKGTKNWRIRHDNVTNKDSFFFIEADLGKDNFYPRVEVMQEDFGDHNGYDRETRLADAKLIQASYKMMELLDYLNNCGGLGYEKHNKIEEILKEILE